MFLQRSLLAENAFGHSNRILSGDMLSRIVFSSSVRLHQQEGSIAPEDNNHTLQ